MFWLSLVDCCRLKALETVFVVLETALSPAGSSQSGQLHGEGAHTDTTLGDAYTQQCAREAKLSVGFGFPCVESVFCRFISS